MENTEYDFIVVGGGTAGLVIAARLTENPAVSVAIVEAGENKLEDPLVAGMNTQHLTFNNKDYDWCFKSEPQLALNGRVVNMPRGKMLGGSSAMNYHMASFPSKVDLDNWEELGNVGWNFESLAPYYRKLERFSPPSANAKASLHADYLDTSLHGSEGPVHVSIPESYWSLAEAWTPAIDNLGVRGHKDSKSGVSIGAHTTLAFVEPTTATRSYSANAYYKPYENRPNLSLFTNAAVSKVTLTGQGSDIAATGVCFTVNNNEIVIKAKKEVIICAGTLGSPQILELSGIGGASLLRSHHIDVVIENGSVGQNYQDHPIAFYSVEVADGEKTMEILRQPEALDMAMREYGEHKTGPLAASLISSAAFVPFRNTLSADGEADAVVSRIQAALAASGPSLDAGTSKQHKLISRNLLYDSEASGQYLLVHAGLPISESGNTARLQENVQGNYITVVAALMHPFSRGSVHICSPSSNVLPKVDPKWLSDPADMSILCKHLLHVTRVLKVDPLASRLKDRGTALLHGYYELTEENVEEFIRNNSDTEHHPVGTCSMLPREEGGVVNSELLVYGTTNLRVVDASVIPLHIAANIAWTVYAIAEKAADMIKHKWNIGV